MPQLRVREAYAAPKGWWHPFFEHAYHLKRKVP